MAGCLTSTAVKRTCRVLSSSRLRARSTTNAGRSRRSATCQTKDAAKGKRKTVPKRAKGGARGGE